ncbi:hypothetical protein H4219_000165 [Mycoemilia scoparia]|uniref:Uncharacterized protein n=1 Tax=Mycoemilia scoparia TaxID=417184 RepID=A0A9W8A3X7_9FUNG|nr:hypothetical protein H4219_000165 [Mycoemilia scoparia]
MRNQKITKVFGTPVNKQIVKPKNTTNLTNFNFITTKSNAIGSLSDSCSDNDSDNDFVIKSPVSSRVSALNTPQRNQKKISTPYTLMKNLGIKSNAQTTKPVSPIIHIPSSPILIHPESPTNTKLTRPRSPSPIILAPQTQYNAVTPKKQKQCINSEEEGSIGVLNSSPLLTNNREHLTQEDIHVISMPKHSSKSHIGTKKVSKDNCDVVPETPKYRKAKATNDDNNNKSAESLKRLKIPEFILNSVPRNELEVKSLDILNKKARSSAMSDRYMVISENDPISESGFTPLQSPISHRENNVLTKPKNKRTQDYVDLISSESEEYDIEFGKPSTLTQWFNPSQQSDGKEGISNQDSQGFDIFENFPGYDESFSDLDCKKEKKPERDKSLSPLLGFVDIRKEVENDPSLEMYLNQFGALPGKEKRRGRKPSSQKESGTAGIEVPDSNTRDRAHANSNSGGGGHKGRWRGRGRRYSRGFKGKGRNKGSSRSKITPVGTNSRPKSTITNGQQIGKLESKNKNVGPPAITSYNHYASEPVLDITGNVGWESRGYARFG